MTGFNTDFTEEKLKLFVQQIAAICLSEEFLILQKELAAMYTRCKVAQAEEIAFQDALYSLLVQNGLSTSNGSSNTKSRAY